VAVELGHLLPVSTDLNCTPSIAVTSPSMRGRLHWFDGVYRDQCSKESGSNIMLLFVVGLHSFVRIVLNLILTNCEDV